MTYEIHSYHVVYLVLFDINPMLWRYVAGDWWGFWELCRRLTARLALYSLARPGHVGSRHRGAAHHLLSLPAKIKGEEGKRRRGAVEGADASWLSIDAPF